MIFVLGPDIPMTTASPPPHARSLVAALRDAGASPHHTEYRGVGHNSWDRAYSDPMIIDWMLAQKRSDKP